MEAGNTLAYNDTAKITDVKKFYSTGPWLCQSGGINKDTTVWLDGARPPPTYIFKNTLSLTNSKIRPFNHIHITQESLQIFVVVNAPEMAEFLLQ